VISLFCTRKQDVVLGSGSSSCVPFCSNPVANRCPDLCKSDTDKAVLHIAWYAHWAARTVTDTSSHADV
jgi:hypothetical protein